MPQLRTLAIFAATLAFAADACSAAPPEHPPQNRRLIWSDEFNGATLDARCWTRDVEAPPWDPQQRVAFTNSTRNSYVRDGALQLDAYREDVDMGGRRNAYSSAQLWTRDFATWTYGYFEARIKMPSGQGAFPAFWLMPQADQYGYWPNSGEIDVVENIGREANIAHTTLHYADAHGNHVSMQNAFAAAAPLSDDFHVYGLEWRPGSMRWFVDNQLVFEQHDWPSPSQTRPFAPFDAKFYMIFDLAVGGAWASEPDASTHFPMHMLVDWVRVYALPEVPESNPQVMQGSSCPPSGPG